jgi:hypothetical protein
MLNSWFSCLPSIIFLFILIGLGGIVQSFRSPTPVQAVPILDCAGIFEVADPEDVMLGVFLKKLMLVLSTYCASATCR